MVKRLVAICFLFSILVACSESSDTVEKELFISAAASLSGALEKISEDYEAENPNVNLTLNFSGSGKLAQQIQQGAPVDVFLSADQYWMDVLEHDNLISPNTRMNFAKNSLVLITHKDSNKKVNSLKDINPNSLGQIAIGNPESVPAGKYAKEALTNVGLSDKLIGHFVYAKDVRQVLTYVESGNVEIGFVYGTDLHRAENVQALMEIDSSLYPPIIYPAAVMSTTEHPELAKDFVEYLQSDSAQVILENYGFLK
ncbi:molybdate ABC transporter substrate-binding protein [Virgibacillus necropolis]|uniref:Molybdate ABC transporter substrate-binding protein n=1 Tax=Virgibacillus necropolis TaxID=163877 RepID=A0A221M863_9BACI|nr:molybdate ABC transporter substrate-binding protein [Virgibacillus necropolis]ASN03815.1 molybdate ABC transporter substrate-binding protein [Virgibacillus necropolis]